jgi:hypothetical protein
VQRNGTFLQRSDHAVIRFGLVFMATWSLCQILGVTALIVPLIISPPAHASELAVGAKSKNADPANAVDIGIQSLASFNGLTKQQILNMRTNEVNRHPDLLFDRYQPNPAVFGQIEDEKPWWGTKGTCIYGSGERSIEGDAEESRFVLNPFLLVGLNPKSGELWDETKLNDGEADRPDFPFFWKPSIVRFWPSRQIVQVAYRVSEFNDRLKQLENRLKDKTPVDEFSLVAYNARDFGYQYIYVPVAESENISNQNDPRNPVRIDQYIHCGGSSGYPGGCNNMSPEQLQIDRFKVLKLPATVKVLLWKSSTSSVKTKPDMTVLIELK